MQAMLGAVWRIYALRRGVLLVFVSGSLMVALKASNITGVANPLLGL